MCSATHRSHVTMFTTLINTAPPELMLIQQGNDRDGCGLSAPADNVIAAKRNKRMALAAYGLHTDSQLALACRLPERLSVGSRLANRVTSIGWPSQVVYGDPECWSVATDARCSCLQQLTACILAI